ncbi:uncharacterized protein [Rhodnius prolixus]|uniref:uncharacterized protein n=1 Tax=Rhodnius prolixus TaxID=13249 RepID=UPI003D18DA94
MRDFARVIDRHESFCIGQPPLKKVRVDENVSIERHQQSLKKNCPEPPKIQLLKLKSEQYESACLGRLKSYFVRSSEFEDLVTFLHSIKNRLYELIKLQLEKKHALKINIVVECLFENVAGEQSDRAFKTRNKAVYTTTDLDEFLEQEFKKLVNEMEESQLKKSGWQLVGVDGARLRINMYKPLGGSTYIKLPDAIAAKKACINPENYDEQCFRYAVLAKYVDKDPQRVSKYKHMSHNYDFSCIAFPTPLHQIRKFEKVNSISINVFALDEEDAIYPLKVTNKELPDHRDLLLLEDGGKHHYVYIKDFKKLVRNQKTRHNGAIKISSSYTTKYQDHIPFSFCTYVKPSDEIDHLWLTKEPFLYRGSNAAQYFLDHLKDLSVSINKILKINEELLIDELEEREWKAAKICYLCKQAFTEDNHKVHDHCHISGMYRGPVCNKCNLQCRTPNYVPVIIHNLSGYDAHLIIKELAKAPGRIDILPHSEENFISFTKFINGIKFRFIDSFRFMSESLSQLVLYLPKNSFRETTKFFNETQLSLVLRKGVFPYDYVNSWKRLEENNLPPKETFYSTLMDSNIDEEDYNHAMKVWNHFKCSTLGEYSDIYLKTDVLLLADVFQNFRNVTMETHKIDPAHYFTAPGMAWDAMLRLTGVKLELLLDYDMILMVERGIRGGICQASLRHCKANNRYMHNYNPSQEYVFIMYYDANNLYGDAQSRFLPYGGFRWVERPEEIRVQDIPDDSECGYILEVDVEYPKHLHLLHDDLPFLAESIVPPSGKANIKKLIPHLGKRERYVVYYTALKQALDYGLKLVKVHGAIQFKQSPWLLPYIKLNTDMRKKAANNFEKNQYKLYNNANFGKTMENVRKRMNFELANNEKRLSKLIAKPNFLDRKIYDENLVGVQMAKTKLYFNKPIYVGLSVLDISKTVLYGFHYEVMLNKYGTERLSLIYTDTDAVLYKISTEDVFKDMRELEHHFDTSDYPHEHPNYSTKNKKVLGKFKDEVNGQIINEVIALRPKMYAINVDGRAPVNSVPCMAFKNSSTVFIFRFQPRGALTLSNFEYSLRINNNVCCIKHNEYLIPIVKVVDNSASLKVVSLKAITSNCDMTMSHDMLKILRKEDKSNG